MDDSAEIRLRRLEARAEIENLIGTYCHLLFAGEGGQIMDELWSQSEHRNRRFRQILHERKGGDLLSEGSYCR